MIPEAAIEASTAQQRQRHNSVDSSRDYGNFGNFDDGVSHGLVMDQKLAQGDGWGAPKREKKKRHAAQAWDGFMKWKSRGSASKASRRYSTS